MENSHSHFGNRSNMYSINAIIAASEMPARKTTDRFLGQLLLFRAHGGRRAHAGAFPNAAVFFSASRTRKKANPLYESDCLSVGDLILRRMLNQSHDLDRLFHALADPARRAMVERLSRGPAPVSELARPLPMSLPAAMQHLDVLITAGLVRSEKVGRVRTCTIEPQALAWPSNGSTPGVSSGATASIVWAST